MRLATDRRALASTYLDAKQAVIEAGFAWESDWQATITFERLTEPWFLREAAWVILCSGMRESVIRDRFKPLSEAFLGWRSAREIITARRACRRRALATFNHRPKIDAIIEIADRVAKTSFESVRANVAQGGIDYLRTLPFIGPVTSYHLAKNIGLQVAKPDRHLTRIAEMFGFHSVQRMCSTISELIYDPIPVVDVVLWRFAALHRQYCRTLMNAYVTFSAHRPHQGGLAEAV